MPGLWTGLTSPQTLRATVSLRHCPTTQSHGESVDATLALRPARIRLALLLTALVAVLMPTMPTMSADDLPSLGIRWAVPASVDPAVRTAAADASSVEVVVQGAPGATSKVAAAVEAAGGELGEPLPIIDGFAATIPAAGVALLEQAEGVKAVSANHAIRFEEFSYDETTTASSFAKTSGATAAWAKGNLGEGVGVAVIDTGVSPM